MALGGSLTPSTNDLSPGNVGRVCVFVTDQMWWLAIHMAVATEVKYFYYFDNTYIWGHEKNAFVKLGF